jgi:hypothetical protein
MARICKLKQKNFREKVRLVFCFEELLYEVFMKDVVPLALRVSE